MISQDLHLQDKVLIVDNSTGEKASYTTFALAAKAINADVSTISDNAYRVGKRTGEYKHYTITLLDNMPRHMSK